jgi:hypothetical protein
MDGHLPLIYLYWERQRVTVAFHRMSEAGPVVQSAALSALRPPEQPSVADFPPAVPAQAANKYLFTNIIKIIISTY